MNMHVVSARSFRLGLTAAVVAWLSSMVSVPFVKMLKNFTPEQLLVWRSVITMIVAYGFARGRIWGFDRYTIIASPVLAISSLSFYRAIRVWDFYSVMLVLVVSMFVNVAVAWREHKKLSPRLFLGLGLIVSGITVGMQPWSRSMNWEGLAWSLSAAVTGGIIFELWNRSSVVATPMCNTFWACATLAAITGLMVCFQPLPRLSEQGIVHDVTALVWFGIVGGALYFSSSVYLFKLLPVVPASLMNQGTTPAIIFGGYLLAHETINVVQCAGMVVALIGIAVVIYWLHSNSDASHQAS